MHKLKDSGLIPDVCDHFPKETLAVRYLDSGKSAEVKFGNELRPSQVSRAPSTVTWTAKPGQLYAIIMVDPDAPSRVEPSYRSWLHWLVTNVPGSEVNRGDLVASYKGSAPPKDTGNHRYFLLVFEQQRGRIDVRETFEKRASFDTRKFINEYGLGDLIAGNYFVASYQG
ncbi:unnamed protein product [Notodromas monacha]|uniref:Phosphatidylethanolamine-binding protein n=1 Tax=Notodromas monacha TaxID=399045 RepID=A0A7R9BRD3_9CRUS|nr:unnamed protein product [Notodromas monacha]CAG0918763.1 unnamed protein product [Notodromas monacha]